MTNTFRRHHKTIMWIVIVGTIISFVAYLSPNIRNAGGGSSGQGLAVGSIDGEAISQPQYDAALREAKVFIKMRTGKWPTAQDAAQQLPAIAFQHMFIAAKLKELKLDVPEESIKAFTRRAFGLRPGEAMPKDRYDDFVRGELNEKGKVGLDDFEHWVRDQVGVELLLRLYGMNGELITSKEAEFFFRRFNESMSVELVRFPATNYASKIVLNPQDVGNFYTNQQANYRLPDREQINYIHFNISNYFALADTNMAGMSNLDTQIDQSYLSRDAATYKDATGNPLSAEAAKAKIKENYRLQLAAQAAQTNAVDMAKRFFDSHKPDPSVTNQVITKDDLEKFAATNGLTVISTPPFDRLNPPKELQLPPQAMDMVFTLDASDPEDQYKLLPATNGFFLVGLERKIPSENQALEVVRAKVTEDYINSKATELANQDGAQFEAAAKAGLAKGLTFEAVCDQQKIKPLLLTPFTLDTTSIPEIEDQNVFEFLDRVVYEIPTGQISPFEPNVPGGGFVAYVKARTPADESVVQRDIPAFLERQRETRQGAAFSVWMSRQMQSTVKQTKLGPDGAPSSS